MLTRMGPPGLAAGLMMSGLLLAQEPGPARAGLEQFSAGWQTLQARFTQVVTSQNGRIESSGGGEVRLARPDLFRWAYEGEFPELIVADGVRVWIFDPTLEQVTVKAQTGLADHSPLILLADISNLDQRFRVTEAGETNGMSLLELVSLSQESEFDRVLLGIEDATLRMMVLEDAFGLRTEIRFDEVTRDPATDPDMFRFVPPPGTDVVGEAEEGPEP